MTSSYILCKRFYLKRKGLSEAKVVWSTKKVLFCSTVFVKINEVFKVIIEWMIKWDFCSSLLYGIFIIRSVYSLV